MQKDDLRGRLRGRRVLVVGDVMLDRYFHGDVNRVSPEAPVPVVELRETMDRPGGAMNAAAGIAALGGDVTIIGVVGKDAAASSMDALARAIGLRPRFVTDASRPSTIKTRVYAQGQQLLRLDRESVEPVASELVGDLRHAVDTEIASSESLLVSDYAKGVLTFDFSARLILSARNRRIPVIVDPKGDEAAKYVGADVITPNLSEAKRLARIAAPVSVGAIAADLRRRLPGTALLVTRGADGMSLFDKEQQLEFRTRAEAVYDVTGAGDTVAAVLSLALAGGIALCEAVELANAAAAIAVTRLGAAQVSIEDLLDYL